MKTLPTLQIFVLIVALAASVSCDGAGTPFKTTDPPTSRFPAAMLEITRPFVNTDLTYFRLVDMEEDDKGEWVDVVEGALKDAIRSGIAIEKAWATPYFTHPTNRCNIGRVGPLLTVRLAAPNPLILDQGFVEDPILSWVDQMCLPKETRHYQFRPRNAAGGPERALELSRPMDDTNTLYHRLWTQVYPSDAVCDGVESFVATLVEEGVDVRNAWSAASALGHEFDFYAIVVEVGSTHPLLERSGFLDEPYNGWNTAVLMWNYCFADCPEEIAVPDPEIMWLAPVYPGPRIYYRSILSSEYEDLIGDQAAAEKELQRLARGGLDVGQAWIPTTRSDRKYTHIVIELVVDETRVAGWGYFRDPGGDPPEFPWDYVWHYDLNLGR